MYTSLSLYYPGKLRTECTRFLTFWSSTWAQPRSSSLMADTPQIQSIFGKMIFFISLYVQVAYSDLALGRGEFQTPWSRFFVPQKEKHKVNRCLARYSPCATTTNRPTNRALNKPAWPGPNWPKMPILGQIWAKNPFFYLRNHKNCYPHNRKPT